MQKAFRFAAVLAFAAVAGCASQHTAPKDSVLVSVSAFGPDNSGQHKHGVGARFDVREGGGETPLAYPPMDLRECNSSNTACALGYGAINGTAEVVSTSETGAVVALNLKYQVGRSYSFSANGQQLKHELSPDVKALQDSQVISKHIELAYGKVVGVPLHYGVEVALCAQKLAPGEILPDRSVCQQD